MAAVAIYRPVVYSELSRAIAATANGFTYAFMEDSVVLEDDPVNAVQGDVELSLLRHSPIVRNIVPRGIRFVFNGTTYFDRGDGRIYRNLDPLTGAAVDSGSVNYQDGVVTIQEYSAGTLTLTVQGLAVGEGIQGGSALAFRTPGAPIGVGSLQLTVTTMDGTELSATAENDGSIVDDEIVGNVNVDTGVVWVEFGHQDGEDWVETPVDLGSIRYNVVIQRYVPLDAERLKLDPTRLPIDGRVPIFLPSQIVVIHHTQTDTINGPIDPGEEVMLSRAPVNKLWLRDSANQLVDEELWSADLETGEITFADPLDLGAYTLPLLATHRIELMRQVNEVQINGLLKLADPLTFNFAADDTYVSTLLEFGDLQARVEHLFTQQTWTNEWSDTRIGADSVGKYNDVAWPVIVNNLHSITERWACVFTGTTTFNVLGEFSGLVIQGNTGQDCSPLNPFTGMPMFTLRTEGWGAGGFVNNNVLRFNTVGAARPLWLLRAIQLGESEIAQDQGAVEFRTDVD